MEAKSEQTSEHSVEVQELPRNNRKDSKESQEKNHGSSSGNHHRGHQQHGNLERQIVPYQYPPQQFLHQGHHQLSQKNLRDNNTMYQLPHVCTKSGNSEKSEEKPQERHSAHRRGASIDNENKSSSSTSSADLPGLERNKTYQKQNYQPSEIR